ncbi:hypothetical protein Q1695_014460 [Nippostrongylus brasiliensis]|nr:hypothetical protein Q1695_014460 [Nippostrongylus brasiliensis]
MQHLQTAFIGLVANAFIAIHIRHLALLRNSFGRLLQLQAVGDSIFGAIWAIYFAPVLIFNIKALQDIQVAARFGQLCLICYDISIYSHLIISLNRFVSVYMPTRYNIIFTEKFTSILVGCTALGSFLFSFFLVYVKCQMCFSVQRWMLDYEVPPCNPTFVYYAEFVRGLVIICAFAVLNACTFIRMIFYNKAKQRKQITVAFDTVQHAKRRSVEKTFVQQVTLQGMLYVLELTTYFYVANYFPVAATDVAHDPNRWPNFLLTTYAWILVHTLDGVITLVFNKQLRHAMRRLFTFYRKGASGSKTLSRGSNVEKTRA